MRVTITFGSLLLGAGLCAARACAPHPRPTTSSSSSNEVGTTTTGGSATTESATTTSSLTSQETLSATESESNIESSVTISTSTTEAFTFTSSFTTKLATTSSDITSQETLTSTESDTAVTLSLSETSTAVDEATSTTIEATTTSADPPTQTTNLVQNGGFEDSTIEPWEATGATPALDQSFCPEGSQCLVLPGLFDGNTAKICQRVEIQQGFEYTFKVYINQNCIASFGSNIVGCSDNVNTVELSIDGVFDSGVTGILADRNYHEFSNTFQYVDPSIDSTDLCISITANQGVFYNFFIDAVSLTRGKAVPIPAETD